MCSGCQTSCKAKREHKSALCWKTWLWKHVFIIHHRLPLSLSEAVQVRLAVIKSSTMMHFVCEFSLDHSQGDDYPSVILQARLVISCLHALQGSLMRQHTVFLWSHSKHYEKPLTPPAGRTLCVFVSASNCWREQRGDAVKAFIIFHKQQLIILKWSEYDLFSAFNLHSV